MQELEGRSEQAVERDKSEKQQQLKSKEDDVDKTPPPSSRPRQPPTCCAMSGHVQTDLQRQLYVKGAEFT